MSIDDVWECFDDLSKDSSSYSSVFEHPFFRELKIAHDLSGAKFTFSSIIPYVSTYLHYNINPSIFPGIFIIQINPQR